VSLPDEDVEFLDAYASANEIASRSTAVHEAVRRLRASDLGSAYEDAWQEWAEQGEAVAWEVSVADGLSDAAR
jgi:Arc/MetJ-type ribon-helix-helix transcriptional regulator